MLRVQILPSGEFLNLTVDTVATVDLFSTLMNNDSDLLGSYSYPGKAPLDEYNKRILQNGHLITSSKTLRSFQARLWLGPTPWKVVNFEYSILDDEIEFNLLIDNGIAMDRLKNTKLNETYSGVQDDSRVFYSYADYKAFMLDTAKAAPGKYPMVFYPVRNELYTKVNDVDQQETYRDYSFPLSYYINEWDGPNQQFVIDTNYPIRHFESPSIYLTYALKWVIKYLGYQPIGNWFDDADAQKIVIESSVGIDSATGNISIPATPYFLPNIALNEFFKAVRNRYALIITFEETNKTCLVAGWKQLITSIDYTDLRPYQVKGVKDYVPETAGYTLTLKLDEKDLLESGDEAVDASLLPVPLVIGDGSTGVDLADSPTIMLVENAPNYPTSQVTWRIPVSKRQYYTSGKFILIEQTGFQDKGDFALRFMIYHGMVHNQANQLYPYAAFDNLDYRLLPMSKYTLTLNANSASSLMVGDFSTFKLASKKLELVFLIPQLIFLLLKNENRCLIRDKNNAVVSCIIDQISADLGYEDIVPAKAVLYTLPIENNTGNIDIPVPPVIPPDNGTVYARLAKRNFRDYNNSYQTIQMSGFVADLYAEFFADPECTVPKNVNSLHITYQNTRYTREGLDPGYSTVYPYGQICTGTEFLLTDTCWLSYSEQEPVDHVYQVTISFTDSYQLIETGDYHIEPDA
jgi:hypothetical protein